MEKVSSKIVCRILVPKAILLTSIATKIEN